MCSSRGEKFVVPIKPSAKMGWWIGQIVGNMNPVFSMSGKEIVLCSINILWVEDPNYKGANIICSSGPFREFDSITEAMNCLKSKKDILSPV